MKLFCKGMYIRTVFWSAWMMSEKTTTKNLAFCRMKLQSMNNGEQAPYERYMAHLRLILIIKTGQYVYLLCKHYIYVYGGRSASDTKRCTILCAYNKQLLDIVQHYAVRLKTTKCFALLSFGKKNSCMLFSPGTYCCWKIQIIKSLRYYTKFSNEVSIIL